MHEANVMRMRFSDYYAHILQEAKRREHTKQEVDTIIMWLTGYDEKMLNQMRESHIDMDHFIQDAPVIHPNASMIQGVIGNQKVEDMEESTLKTVRQLEIMLNELNKHEPLSVILRS